MRSPVAHPHLKKKAAVADDSIQSAPRPEGVREHSRGVCVCVCGGWREVSKCSSSSPQCVSSPALSSFGWTSNLINPPVRSESHHEQKSAALPPSVRPCRSQKDERGRRQMQSSAVPMLMTAQAGGETPPLEPSAN